MFQSLGSRADRSRNHFNTSIYLPSGAFIDWGNNNARITHAQSQLSADGGNGFNWIVGSPTSASGVFKQITIIGSDTGTGAGGFIQCDLGTSTTLSWGVGNRSSMLGSAFSNQLLIRGSTGIDLRVGSTDVTTLSTTALSPFANDGAALGTASLSWSDLFLASGGVINWNNGGITITETGDNVSFTGASSGWTFDANVFLSTAGGGVWLAAGTTGGAPLMFASGTNLTTALAGAMEYDGKVLYSTPVGSNRGVSPSVHFLSLSANQTGSDVNTAQPWFPGGGATGITAAASTSYFFEGILATTRSAGGNAHTTAIGFGGTATITSIAYRERWSANAGTATFPNTPTATGETFVETATSTVMTGSITNASETFLIYVNGIVRINASGTFIPQFTYSAAPGGAPTVRANSFFRMWPVGSNTVLNVGNWS